jgi:NAD+ synthase
MATAAKPRADYPRPEINAPLVHKLLVAFIRNEFHKVGVKRAVLGVSGGVDSSLSAILGAHALGPENVLGIMMPYKTSSKESLEHARLLAERAGIKTIAVDISPQIDAYFERFPEADRLRRGNKMARERMTILYDHSAQFGALVLGTSNKTELLLGYGTLYGDMASAVNPNGDLYKTQIWALAAEVGVPEEIVSKQPSPDLWVGQTSEGELGFSYRQVDELLFLMIDRRYSDEELREAGFPEHFIRRVSEMVRNSQFKRRLPVIAKLSERTIDRDFRYARDWGR